jgi:ABC-type molybdate transport system ATPase subunit
MEHEDLLLCLQDPSQSSYNVLKSHIYACTHTHKKVDSIMLECK